VPLIESIRKEWDEAVPNLIKTVSQDVNFIFNISKARSSLASVIRDWCETLSEQTKQYLFPNNENRILSLMLSVTNDESSFVQRLAKSVTSLRIEDWGSHTVLNFLQDLRIFKKTVEDYNVVKKHVEERKAEEYKIMFKDESGRDITKTFGRIECTGKAKILFNAIQTDLDEHGQAITEQEKRQVLMDLLQKLC
jgi:hypothetical protein